MQESALSLALQLINCSWGIKDSLFVVSEEIVVIELFGHTRVDLLKSTDFDPFIPIVEEWLIPKEYIKIFEST